MLPCILALSSTILMFNFSVDFLIQINEIEIANLIVSIQYQSIII